MDAGALEGVEIIDGGTAIAASAGDNHGTGARSFLAAEGQQEPAMVAAVRTLQRDHFIRNSHGGGVFLDLVITPSHQCHAADAGGKAKIVLDPRRCTSLA